MNGTIRTALLLYLLTGSASPVAQDTAFEFHEDYYLGFSQGAYYGLMLAGVQYEVAWCVKSELEFEAAGLGAGGEFQAGIERIFQRCSGQQ